MVKLEGDIFLIKSLCLFTFIQGFLQKHDLSILKRKMFSQK